MKLQDLHENKQPRHDEVMKLVQKELWPIAKRLERALKGGTVVTMRDKDGSVLADSQRKAIEIVQKYKGDHAGKHIRAIQAASDYKEVQHILSNVLLHGEGQSVVKPS